jgi:hypothetical protein
MMTVLQALRWMVSVTVNASADAKTVLLLHSQNNDLLSLLPSGHDSVLATQTPSLNWFSLEAPSLPPKWIAECLLN